jgi:hypothetical protein
MSMTENQPLRRGVLYVVWGDAVQPVLQRSIASVRKHHPELPIHVVTLPSHLDAHAGLLEKSRMMDMTPFDSTLFLDADTVVLGRLDFGFRQAERHGLACTIGECPWAGRYAGLSGDLIEYNTGVLFFTRKAAPVFERWKEVAPTLDSSFLHIPPGDEKVVGRMPFNDQAGFAKAVDDTGFLPAALPHNWNFRPRWQFSFFGPLKIWHEYVDPPESLLKVNAYYEENENPIYQNVRTG